MMWRMLAAVSALGVAALTGCSSDDGRGELGVSYSADVLSGGSFEFTVESIQVSDDPAVCPPSDAVAGGPPIAPKGYYVVLEMTADASDLSPGVEVDPSDASGFDLTDPDGWKDPGPIDSYDAFICEGFAGFSGYLKAGQKAAFHAVLESSTPAGTVTVHGVDFDYSV